MTDLELNRRLSNDPSTAGQGPENRDGTAGSSYLTADPVVDDVLPAISLVLMLLAEIARHSERLNRLEFNSRQREALARRRAEGTQFIVLARRLFCGMAGFWLSRERPCWLAVGRQLRRTVRCRRGNSLKT